MTGPTDEQFAAAYDDMVFYDDRAINGRGALAALQAHGCIPQQQGLSLRQDVALRLLCADVCVEVETAAKIADAILALGDPQ